MGKIDRFRLVTYFVTSLGTTGTKSSYNRKLYNDTHLEKNGDESEEQAEQRNGNHRRGGFNERIKQKIPENQNRNWDLIDPIISPHFIYDQSGSNFAFFLAR